MRSTLYSPAVKRLLLATLWLAGCTQTVVVGSRYVKSERIAAGAAANLVVTTADEPALAGTTLQIPTGALASDTTLTLELGSTDIADDPSGPVAVWGPSGTTFATPATLSLPFTLPSDANTSELEVEVLEDNGTRITLPNSALVIDTTNRLVRFSVSSFTRFQPKRHRPCTSNAQCSSGQYCLTGVCQPETSCFNNDICSDPFNEGIFRCVDPGSPPLANCGSDADCAAGEGCFSTSANGPLGVCQRRCSSSTADAGVSTGNGCTSNAQCPSGQCVGTVCAPVVACPRSLTCEDPFSSGSFRCFDADFPSGAPTCSSELGCAPGFTCYPVSPRGFLGVCQLNCLPAEGGVDGGEDAGAEDGGAADGGCSLDTDCAAGQECRSNECIAVSACTGGAVCLNPFSGGLRDGSYRCLQRDGNPLPGGVPCGIDAECSAGFGCYPETERGPLGTCMQNCPKP